jgi:hypothetical protein
LGVELDSYLLRRGEEVWNRNISHAVENRSAG